MQSSVDESKRQLQGIVRLVLMHYRCKRILFVCSEPVKEEPKEPVGPGGQSQENWLRLLRKSDDSTGGEARRTFCRKSKLLLDPETVYYIDLCLGLCIECLKSAWIREITIDQLTFARGKKMLVFLIFHLKHISTITANSH